MKTDIRLCEFITENPIKHEKDKCIKAQVIVEPEKKDRYKTLKEITCSCYYENINLLNAMSDSWFQKTAKIVYILEKKHTRYAAGKLKMLVKNIPPYTEKVLFSPNDSRLQRLLIDISECPSDFMQNSIFYEKTLFIAEIIDTPANCNYALGQTNWILHTRI